MARQLKVSKRDFMKWLATAKSDARCGDPNRCVIAKYLIEKRGYHSASVGGGISVMTVKGTRLATALPAWAAAVIRVFDKISPQLSAVKSDVYRPIVARELHNFPDAP